MRIVIDATAAVSGGRVYLANLLQHVAQLRADDEFIVFHTDDFADVAQRIDSPSVRFRRVALPKSSVGQWLGAGVLKVLWRLFVLPQHLRRLKPEVVFSNAGFGPGRRPKETKLVVALHNSMPLHDDLVRSETSWLRRTRLAMLKWLLGRTLRHCDGVIVFSEDLKGRVIASFDGLKCRPSVIYHGVDWGKAEQTAKPNLERLNRFGVRRPYLLYVSHFHRYKNMLCLLEAFAGLAVNHPPISLVIIGEVMDQSYWLEINETIKRLDLIEKVRLIPGCAREELKEFYRSALAFVYPSLAENCPFAVLEALAFGLPIIAARASSLPEIGGDAALYFDPHNPAELTAMLNKVVEGEELRATLSRKAAERAGYFSWQSSAEQTLRLFENLTCDKDQAEETVGQQSAIL